MVKFETNKKIKKIHDLLIHVVPDEINQILPNQNY